MATDVIMPKMGATMEEGTIVTWFLNKGDYVEEGSPIAEIQTDKIAIEIEAEVSGTLLHTCYEAGETVKVHEVIAYIGEKDELIEDSNSSKKMEVIEQVKEKEQVLPPPSTAENFQKIRRTPAARVLANEHRIDLSEVSGTGPNGRIEKKDVLHFINSKKKKITPLASKIAAAENLDIENIAGTGAYQKITKKDLMLPKISEKSKPLKGMRKVIADRMSQSAFTAPHVTITSEIDMTSCINLRKELLPEIERSTGLRLSFNEILLFATAKTLSKHPNMNASIIDDYIVEHESINIGFAVSVGDGLLVPVVKDANKLGLTELTAACKELGLLAREGKLLPHHLEEGTFTISNLGMYAVDSFTPIINQPQSAILGVGRIVEKPAVINKAIEIRSMMVLSLSFDHRLIDGAPAAAFLTDLKEILENPMKLLL